MDDMCSRYVHLCNEYLNSGDLYEEELIGLSKQLYRQTTTASVADTLVKRNVIQTALLSLQASIYSKVLNGAGVDDSRGMIQYITNVALMCANFTSCGQIYVQHVWSCTARISLSDVFVVVASTKSPKAVCAFLSMLCNCLRRPESASAVDAHRRRLDEIITDRSLCCQVLLCSLPSLHPQPSHLPADRTDGQSAIDEWMLIFVRHAVVQSKYLALLSTVASARASLDAPSSALNHEQLILLHIVNEVLQDTSVHTHILENQSELRAFALYAREALLGLFCASTAIPTSDTEMIAKNAAQSEMITSSVFILIAVLGSVLTIAHDDASIREQLIRSTSPSPDSIDIVIVCDTVLRYLNTSVVVDSSCASSGIAQLLREEEEGFRNELGKNTLCLLCNLTYKSSLVQERLLQVGCLATLLGHCATNFANPLAREWALLAVRNACEGCDSNQAFIESLKPQGVIQDDAMRRQGISAEIDPSTGRFKFNQQSK